MADNDRIDLHSHARGGKPVVRGTAVTAMSIFSDWEHGLSAAEIIAAHPELTVEDIDAAVAFARAELARRGEVSARRPR